MKSYLRIISAAIFLPFLAQPVSATPVQWTVEAGGNGHWYEFVGTPTHWTDAVGAANASSLNGVNGGGYLATVTSQAENDFIFSLTNGALTWLGGSDAASEGHWEWVFGPEAGQALTYSNWSSGEPNNSYRPDGSLDGSGPGTENYLLMLWTGAWNDGHPHTTPLSYVIEYGGYESNSVPEPSTFALALVGLGVFGAMRRRRKAC